MDHGVGHLGRVWADSLTGDWGEAGGLVGDAGALDGLEGSLGALLDACRVIMFRYNSCHINCPHGKSVDWILMILTGEVACLLRLEGSTEGWARGLDRALGDHGGHLGCDDAGCHCGGFDDCDGNCKVAIRLVMEKGWIRLTRLGV